MAALYADTRETRDPEMARLVGIALTVHPEDMVAAVGAFDSEELVGHAALRPFEDSLEVKRVFVAAGLPGPGDLQTPDARARGDRSASAERRRSSCRRAHNRSRRSLFTRSSGTSPSNGSARMRQFHFSSASERRFSSVPELVEGPMTWWPFDELSADVPENCIDS